MAKNVVKPSTQGVSMYPGSPPPSLNMSEEFPELPPMADTETGDALAIEAPEDPEQFRTPDAMKDLLDSYSPPFQPQMLPEAEPTNYRTQGPALTKGYGTTMASYLYERKLKPRPPSRRAGEVIPEMDSQSPQPGEYKNAVVTKVPEALRVAMSQLGIASSRNPGGLSIDLNTARMIMTGKPNLGEVDEAELRSNLESGDVNIDKKKVRQFVNHDGSVTYEVLNDDKSVMSRFTLGQYKGQKLFVQGGYGAYAQELRVIAGRMAKAQTQNTEFDRIRKGRG